MNLAGKRAIVTGAAGALGRVIADHLAAAGADVAGLDLNADGLATVADQVRKHGVEALAVPADLTDFAAVDAAAGRVVDAWGGVDILVNGAGGGAVAPFHEMTAQVWATQIDRNLTTVFNVTRAVLPSMLAQRHGRIVNIASIAAVSGGRLVRNATAYAAAKAGVIGLTKALAIEVAEAGVTVNCLAPGAQATPGRDRDTPQRREELLAQIPTRLLGEPDHLAETVVFLASPAAVNITGVILPLDGGHSI
ncbi:SDR family NAD(P)-dependent oxidoreductase [Dactylosporangium sp. AC04546]|uniref:SDR family NAD(P)-dependent oxidoreductase n=1 Tax=Dactylosporangium sp. AC04546 TaxID=2862460 RepID=UPI001EDE33AA|nr:SDR family NAD(P)-dependent oxidoreductase [Dactylosporangium sp. AC04546]WVK87186.1 SDR family NAD(P)-dependent oxidoreductase [Dactylosporangium sp. AC04546]